MRKLRSEFESWIFSSTMWPCPRCLICLSLSVLICNTELMIRPFKPTWQSCYEHPRICWGLKSNSAICRVQNPLSFLPLWNSHDQFSGPTAAIHRASNSLAVLLPHHLQALLASSGVTQRAWMPSFNYILQTSVDHQTVPSADIQWGARWLWTGRKPSQIPTLISRSLQIANHARKELYRVVQDSGWHKGAGGYDLIRETRISLSEKVVLQLKLGWGD